eukprot:8121990-Lingulodinium_polyedra.AAC.1
MELPDGTTLEQRALARPLKGPYHQRAQKDGRFGAVLSRSRYQAYRPFSPPRQRCGDCCTQGTRRHG